MLSSDIKAVTDPEEYAATMRPAGVEVTITETGTFDARLIRINLHRLWMQRGQVALAHILYGLQGATRSFILFPTERAPELVWNGLKLGANDIGLHRAGHSFYNRFTAPAQWASMSLTLEDLAEIEAIAGEELVGSQGAPIATPGPVELATLKRLHSAAGQLAESAPEIIANTDAARGLEQELIYGMIRCLAGTGRNADARVWRRRSSIMSRFHEALEESSGEPLYVPELCVKLGIPERTLRLYCHEHFGMGPKRFLFLRRMNLAQKKLRACCSKRTVTEIAMEAGFWEMGRFAVQYKTMFGESPSATLREFTR